MSPDTNENIQKIRNNRAANVRILSGRLGGEYLQNGRPRGGTCDTKQVVKKYYEAIQLSPDDVLRNRNLIDNPNGIFVSSIAVGKEIITFKLDHLGRCFDSEVRIEHGDIVEFNKK